jgi:hypothetical protein
MSFALKNVNVDVNAAQEGISTNGKLGDRSVGVKANVNATLPEGWAAKLTVTDKTARDLAKNVSVNPAGASLQINNGDRVRLQYNLEKQRANVRVAHKVNVSNKDIHCSAEYQQGDNHEVDLEASHDLDDNTNITLSYGVHNQELSAKMRYKLDNSTVTPEVNVATQHWRVQLDHKVSNQDRLEAVLEKGDDPRLAYIRNQDGVELRLEAPVRSDIAAKASIRVQRTFEL